MARLHRIVFISASLLVCTLVMVLPSTVSAYTQWSQGNDSGNCATCHGDFRAGSYISPADGQNWGNLHNLHRTTMLGGDCDTCHGGSNRFPVLLDDSDGGSGLESISCMGCHGRTEDTGPSNPDFSSGAGAGLRQHHTNAGVTVCTGCHEDAAPANYTPVGEEILPPYYANPGTGHPAMPTAPCNDDGSENFAGAAIGLDNDGNDVYDTDDAACSVTGVPDHALAAARLLQNHPNPFNPYTQIKYVVERPGQVRLNVYSVAGKLVRTLVNGRHEEAKTYQTSWDGRDDDGRPLPSGVFFYRLESPDASVMKTMVLLK